MRGDEQSMLEILLTTTILKPIARSLVAANLSLAISHNRDLKGIQPTSRVGVLKVERMRTDEPKTRVIIPITKVICVLAIEIDLEVQEKRMTRGSSEAIAKDIVEAKKDLIRRKALQVRTAWDLKTTCVCESESPTKIGHKTRVTRTTMHLLGTAVRSIDSTEPQALIGAEKILTTTTVVKMRIEMRGMVRMEGMTTATLIHEGMVAHDLVLARHPTHIGSTFDKSLASDMRDTEDTMTTESSTTATVTTIMNESALFIETETETMGIRVSGIVPIKERRSVSLSLVCCKRCLEYR